MYLSGTYFLMIVRHYVANIFTHNAFCFVTS